MSIQTVFITGCSSGIGLASAKLFHKKGWNVIATLRSPASAPQDLKDLAGERLLIAKCDVTDIQTIESAVQETIKKFGEVTCLVNNVCLNMLQHPAVAAH